MLRRHTHVLDAFRKFADKPAALLSVVGRPAFCTRKCDVSSLAALIAKKRQMSDHIEGCELAGSAAFVEELCVAVKYSALALQLGDDPCQGGLLRTAELPGAPDLLD